VVPEYIVLIDCIASSLRMKYQTLSFHVTDYPVISF
jgi:hypothetical protein